MSNLSPKVRDVLVYLLQKYPYQRDLSKARTIKFLYLCDWLSAVERGQTVTDIDWYFNHYGPYVRDIENQVRSSPEIRWQSGRNAYGTPKETLAWRQQPIGKPRLSRTDREVIDRVISETESMNFTEFLNLVYNTYPVKRTEKYEGMDLLQLAKQYKSSR
jgi:hypothetical protein